MRRTNAHARIKHPPDARELATRVQAEYAEMPGLSITLPQAQRLWSADRRTCEAVFGELLARRVLRMTAKGRFVKAA